ncbi:DUF4406 domain-containing protein [Arthrobacter sp. R4]|uniref:DUF4406 domain-containing protein n=1 Tax=Arthrobacter sp. R4 TaxID=644417 RepID=UPI003EDB1B96
MAKLYIAGPMSGLPEYNYPAFHAAEARLKAAGYETLNPANNPEQDSWEGYMRAAIAQVVQADGIAYLPGSYSSRGARLELRLAEELSMKTAPLDSWIL